MEGSEPSLVPEWLRSTGGSNLFASSQTDSSSSLPKRNKTSKNPNTPYFSSFDQSSSTNSRRRLNSNGCGKQERNSYSRSYSYSARNQPNKDRERLDIYDPWDSDSLKSIIAGRSEKDALKRTQSMISRRPNELSQCQVFTDLRNRSHHINSNGNAAIAADSGATGIQKVSLEKDFPLLRSDERPRTPDIVRVPSPGLSRGVQGLSIGTCSLVGIEGGTSVLAEVPMGVGTDCGLSLPALQSPPYVAAAAAAATAPSASGAGASNGLNMAEALVKVPASNNAPQQSVKTQRSMELPFMVSKRLIPVTPSPKTVVHNPSDKLKPKTTSRPLDSGGGLKNGLQQMSSSQLGGQLTRNVSARGDGLRSSTGKMLLLKPARENDVSPASKDAPSQTMHVSSMIANGSSTAVTHVASVPLRSPIKAKLPTAECRTSAYGLNAVSVADKRLTVAQLQSRNDFFNLVRKKSMGGTLSTGSSMNVSSGEHNSDELKELASDRVTAIENGSDVKYNGDPCSLAENFSDQKENDLSEDKVIYPNEEERAFLRSLGWEEDAGDDEGLTEEEINSFYQKYMEWIPASKLSRGCSKMITQSDSQTSHSAAASLS